MSASQCFPVDRLHQDYNGVTKHLLDALDNHLVLEHGRAHADSITATVNERLADMRAYHEAFYPTDGTIAVMAQAEEMRGLMKFLPIAMYGLVEDEVAEVFAGYARWQHIRDSNEHTEANLEFLEEYTIRLMDNITATFGHVKDFNFPKFFNMRKYPQTIREFGMISIADTGKNEAFNKVLRAAYDSTYKKHNGLNQQVANKMQIIEGLQHAKASATEGNSTATKMGARQRAQQSGEASMSSSGKQFWFDRMYQNNTWESKLLQHIPQLCHMQAAIQADLQLTQPPAMVTLKRTLGLPRCEGVTDIVRSHFCVFDRTSNCLQLDDVAYKGCDFTDKMGVDVEDTWYAQVVVLGTYRQTLVDGSTDMVDFLFVRKYACPLSLTNNQTDTWYQGANFPGQQPGRRMPLTLRPLVWEPSPKSKKKVTTVHGSYAAITADMLVSQVCIVPDYKHGEGNFLLNDLVHLPSPDLQLWD